MTEPTFDRVSASHDEEVSLLALGSILLRHRRLIIGLAMGGALLGLVLGISSKRKYVSSARFIPQGSEDPASGLALAASQFGVRIPSSNNAWGPPVYVEVIRSPAVLDPIVGETVTVAEQGGRRVALADLLKIHETNPGRRREMTVRRLQSIISAGEDKKTGSVTVAVRTEWPSVSYWLAQRLVQGMDEFNLNTRKSQAAAERKFVEKQAIEAERALREAENRLQSFLEQNRDLSSTRRYMEKERLSRDVAMVEQVHTSMVQNLEEARIREVRNTPVITLLETPKLPAVGEPRGSVKKGLMGGILGGILGAFIAILGQAASRARQSPNPEAREFFSLMGELRPGFLKRKRA